MAISSEVRALIITLDPLLGTIVGEVAQEVGIGTLTSSSSSGAPQELGHEKFDALLVDFDTIADTGSILTTLRRSASNSTAVVLAVATGVERKKSALNSGANFVFERPLQMEEVRRTLRVAYDLIHGERRRYFRCAAKLAVRLTDAFGKTTVSTTMNISSNGLAASSPVPLRVAQTLEISFVLPNGDEVQATGVVVWDDKHGKSGLHFQRCQPGMQRKLDAWLDAQCAGQSNNFLR